MKTDGSGHRFFLSRAVEEPMEATFEMGEDIKDISTRARRPVLLGAAGLLIFMAFLVLGLISAFQELIEGFQSGVLFFGPLLGAAVYGFVLAICVTTLVYLYQVHRFSVYLLGRYSAVSGLLEARLDKGKKTQRIRDGKPEVEKPLANPIFATMDMVEESMHELPQVQKLMRFCTYFMSVVAIFAVAVLTLSLAGLGGATTELDLPETVLDILALVVLIIALVFLIDSEQLFRFLEVRHNIIDSVRFQEDIRIPKGEDPLSRLIAFLKERDPYIKSAGLDGKGSFKKSIELSGMSGAKHGFDAYFSGTNVLKSQSVSMGMPMGNFSVFIRVFRDDISRDDLVALREAALDVCKKDRVFPLRIIALQWDIKELADEVYEFVFDNPVQTKNVLTHIEIISEDGDVYSFIPIISYGEKPG
jgi:hypothetical protein